MYILKSVEVIGFRGASKRILIQADRSANFIIGRNGAGKTTLINLIKAILQADDDYLATFRFKSVTIKLKRDDSRKYASIFVEKSSADGVEFIYYRVDNPQLAEPLEFEIGMRISAKMSHMDAMKVASVMAMRRGEVGDSKKRLQKALGALFSVSWLSLHRSDPVSDTDEEDVYPWDFEQEGESGSGVDTKLKQVFDSLSSYFYKLDALVGFKVEEFQKKWILSYIDSVSEWNSRAIRAIDPEKEKISLKKIFENFAVEPRLVNQGLEKHFEKFKNSREILSSSKLEIFDASVILDTMRLHKLVGNWQFLETEKSAILGPKDNFSKICNKMLYRKRIEFSKSNQIIVKDDDGAMLNVQNLSSGEKQLLIFLSETLLQEEHAHIFLADEPELSLHVEWQEELVRNILSINPNAQVLFATHSPDIISGYSKNVFRMEGVA